MPGATTASVLAFEVDGVQYALKLFTNAAFAAEVPDLAIHEATVLQALETIDVPTPRLVGVDDDGSQCGAPAVLMTRLPGGRGVGEVHAAELVHIAARLHAVQSNLPWVFQRYNDGLETRPPEWGRDAELWADVLEVASSEATRNGWGFIHRDYNSTNFLTQGGRVSGVVDWLSACRGPFGIDAARLRLDLTLDGRGDVAEAVGVAFGQSDREVIDPYWDLVDAVDLLPFYEGAEAVDRWGDPDRRQRLEGFVRDALRRF